MDTASFNKAPYKLISMHQLLVKLQWNLMLAYSFMEMKAEYYYGKLIQVLQPSFESLVIKVNNSYIRNYGEEEYNATINKLIICENEDKDNQVAKLLNMIRDRMAHLNDVEDGEDVDVGEDGEDVDNDVEDGEDVDNDVEDGEDIEDDEDGEDDEDIEDVEDVEDVEDIGSNVCNQPCQNDCECKGKNDVFV